MRRLPAMWKDAGLPYLDDGGHIALPKSQKEVSWNELCLRAPQMFDVALAKGSNKTFSGTVLTSFSSIVPGWKAS